MIALPVVDLPQPGLADDAERLAVGEVEADVADGVDRAARRRELDDQVLDLEHQVVVVRRGGGRCRCRPSDAALAHVEARAHLVADEVQGEDREEHEQRREQHHVRRALELRAAVLDHDAPAHAADVADAEERQRGLDDDQRGDDR